MIDTPYRFCNAKLAIRSELGRTRAILISIPPCAFPFHSRSLPFRSRTLVRPVLSKIRGRLGLRAGTSYGLWGTTTVEPFIIGSLWGNLSGDNQSTLVSSGTTFRFQDDLDDVWGEVSAGVNFFNSSALTALFAKIDVTFGDDVDGIGGKIGMRTAGRATEFALPVLECKSTLHGVVLQNLAKLHP